MKSKSFFIAALSAAAIALTPLPTTAQNAAVELQQPFAVTVEGTVVSSSPNTMTVRLDDGLHQLFSFESYTTRPQAIPNGARVRTVSTPSEDPGLRIAQSVEIVQSPPQQATLAPASPIPPSLRQLEQDIERQARRYRVGVRAGVGLDPEMVLAGVHAQLGPVFRSNVWFRPNVEFGLGEVTALIALNMEAIYRFSGSSQQGRWSAYAGAGPGFNFTHQNFERFTGEDTPVLSGYSYKVWLRVAQL
jgi:hypothetical protein